jgi:hypothetical protein
MEVRCISCGIFFSIDDHLYKGEYENFCSIKCQTDWMEKLVNSEPVETLSADDTANVFKWSTPEEKEDGASN